MYRRRDADDVGLIGGYLLVRRQNPFSGGGGRDRLLLLLSGGAMGINWILLFAVSYTHLRAHET